MPVETVQDGTNFTGNFWDTSITQDVDVDTTLNLDFRPLDDDVTLSLLKRAKDNQYTALVVTLDTFQLGWRPKDLARAYLPFIHGVGCSIPFSDPVFMSKIGQQVSHAHPAFPYDAKTLNEIISAGGSAYSDTLKDRKVAAAQWMMEQINSGTYRKWGDLAFLRNNWEGPLILKGIQNVHDAHQAIDAGVDGIIVSNHGKSRPGSSIESRCWFNGDYFFLSQVGAK